ncbi:histidine phosphatase family protein [Salinibius halmophilus]|uniref:histidine phosphatase family protein n=1 Tax=Salinibius halmophilus TaxID=1853216 RepID=UPI00131422F0|nr:histidine phosphatase family protein [Salinibius halmophilus]
MKRLIIARHPRPVIQPGVCYGQLDVNAQEDHLQLVAQHLTSALRPFRVQHVISSDLYRCQALAEQLPYQYVISPLWRERSFGSWEGQTWDDIGKSALDNWANDPFFFAPPNGESLWDMLKRILLALALLPNHSLVIAHAGVVRCLDLLLTGKNIYANASLDYGMYRQFEWNPTWWPHRYGAEGALLQQLAIAHRGHGNFMPNR